MISKKQKKGKWKSDNNEDTLKEPKINEGGTKKERNGYR